MDIKILKEAALKFGTPIYLYDLKIIQNQFDKLIKELSVLMTTKFILQLNLFLISQF